VEKVSIVINNLQWITLHCIWWYVQQPYGLARNCTMMIVLWYINYSAKAKLEEVGGVCCDDREVLFPSNHSDFNN